MLLVGSRALSTQGLKPRRPISKDIDFIVTEEEAIAIRDKYSSYEIQETVSGFAVHLEDSIIDCEVAKEGSSGFALLELENAVEELVVASMDTVYALKMSHRYKKDSPHFYKTMKDIKYLRTMAAKIPDHLIEWYTFREKETYDYSHPNLNQSKEDFFDENESFYVYDHDTLHLAVAQRDYPAYLDFKDPNHPVRCLREKFNECSYQVKLNSLVEEAMVLTLERSLVPNNFEPEERKMYIYALMKVCTSITSGWWRTWAWEHFEEAIKYYDNLGSDKWITNSFNNAKSAGLIKPFKGDLYD